MDEGGSPSLSKLCEVDCPLCVFGGDSLHGERLGRVQWCVDRRLRWTPPRGRDSFEWRVM